MMMNIPAISTFLWFERNAEVAAEFYTTLFPESRITHVARGGDGGPVPKGSVMTVAFELAGHKVTAINGGPHYALTPAVSLVVSCQTQDEIDHYWDALIADGGKPSRCGWLVDRFGLSWQVVPSNLGELLTDADPAKAGRVGRAMMGMEKLDLATLRGAHRGEQIMTSGVEAR
jgi:predicted 3-demethylubiquinone-9 3-methyltransferase (glyoxalase superfamily)